MKFTANLVSIIFHPVLLPLYASLAIIQANPIAFRFGEYDSRWLILQLIILTVVMPGFTISIMKPLGFIKSFKMKDRTERILPMVAGLFYYIWIVVLYIKQGLVPEILTVLMAGVLLTLIFSFLINLLVVKISLHTAGMGILMGYFLGMIAFSERDLIPVLILVILAAGIVGTSRLFLKAHNEEEIYLGYFTGMLGQLIAIYIIF